jgi:hypothetical protein
MRDLSCRCWEKEASLALSRADVQVISAYARHKRIREGLTEEMVDAAYVAWRADCAAGRASILVTESARDVRALNERARAERLLLDGAVDHREAQLVDGPHAQRKATPDAGGRWKVSSQVRGRFQTLSRWASPTRV